MVYMKSNVGFLLHVSRAAMSLSKGSELAARSKVAPIGVRRSPPMTEVVPPVAEDLLHEDEDVRTTNGSAGARRSPPVTALVPPVADDPLDEDEDAADGRRVRRSPAADGG